MGGKHGAETGKPTEAGALKGKGHLMMRIRHHAADLLSSLRQHINRGTQEEFASSPFII